ncbi:MAG: rhomboid family intramembrane serine protease [Hyphomicrobiales bacterium]|nr:rhomboid family intramembrane serine protease [Hyphomicrobiales bacterium]MDE2116098.1 rhomboid family intramembrane serine protease [Hyphomicrobiales bacterium]
MPSQRQPIFNVPASILAILGFLIVAHFIRLQVSEATDAEILRQLSFVPARVSWLWDPQAVKMHVANLASQGASGQNAAQDAQFFIGDGSLKIWTLLTYAALHGSWVHLGSNGVWLLAFGSPVAKRFGTWRFILFFCFTAIAGAGAHFLAHPYGVDPVIGASAAVSGAMGAAMRFAFQQGGPLGLGGGDAWVQPLSVAGVFKDRRTLTFLVVWFVTNFLFGVAAVPMGISNAPIAWEAHIGGFLAGLFGFFLFDPPAALMREKLASEAQQAHSDDMAGDMPAEYKTGGQDDGRSHSGE